MAKHNLFLLLILVVPSIHVSEDEAKCGQDWTAIGKESCYRLVQQAATWDQAREICAKLEKGTDSTLVAIKSKEEEDLVEDFLFTKKGVLENVWIGAKRVNNGSDFKWTDGYKVAFTHWSANNPDNDHAKNCVEMVAESSSKGSWRNTQCNKHNFNVLCQKGQIISLSELAQIVMDLKKTYNEEKKVLKDTIAAMQNTESELVSKIAAMAKTESALNQTVKDIEAKVKEFEKDNTELKSEVESLKKKENAMTSSIEAMKRQESRLSDGIENLKASEASLKEEVRELKGKCGSSSAPKNSVYVQYPSQMEPYLLWNCSGGSWRDISGSYANLFFRVDGDKTATFGHMQSESAPKLEKVQHENCDANQAYCTPHRNDVNIRSGQLSDQIYISSQYHASVTQFHHMRLKVSGGEVRPRNMAVKVWKCI